MTDLTHADAEGRARMVDVGAKAETARTARAEGTISMNREALEAIERNAAMAIVALDDIPREIMRAVDDERPSLRAAR